MSQNVIYVSNSMEDDINIATKTLIKTISIAIQVLDVLQDVHAHLYLPIFHIQAVKKRLTRLNKSLAGHRNIKESLTSYPSHLSLSKAAIDSLSWLFSMLVECNRIAVSVSVTLCRQIFIAMTYLTGVQLAFWTINQLCNLADWFWATLCHQYQNLSLCNNNKSELTSRTNYIDHPDLTAIVLEYRERDCIMPQNVHRRIQSVMHFQIPLRTFEAVVRLPSPIEDNNDSTSNTSKQLSTSENKHASTTPRSIPTSPIAQKRAQLAFANFSDDILYQARDRLRRERAVALTGEKSLRIPRFNVQDCSEGIYLACGRHRATKVGSGMYRSVRTTVAVPKARYIYFEMALKSLVSSLSKDTGELRACLGLSTRSMNLNTLVGTVSNTIGFLSTGKILRGPDVSNSCDFDVTDVSSRYDRHATIGILVYIHENDCVQQANAMTLVEVQFSVNGNWVYINKNTHQKTFQFNIPARAQVFPTLTLHSRDVQVDGCFSAADLKDRFNDEQNLDDLQAHGVWCLDGLRLNI